MREVETHGEKLEVMVAVEPDDDPEEIAEATSALRRRLLDLDVDRVEPVVAGAAPPGARSGELVEIGQLVVQLAQGAAALSGLIGVVQAWASTRRRPGTVKLSIGGDVVEFGPDLAPEQRRAVDAWLRRHAPE